MRYLIPLSLLLPTALSLLPPTTLTSSSITTCHALLRALPDSVAFPGTPAFLYTNTQYYDTGSARGAGCTFLPRDAGELGVGVRILVSGGTKFAVKSGGHMAGYNAIDAEGVLVSMERVKGVEWRDGGEVVRVGAGMEWGGVYAEVEKKGRVVVGGRVKSVGVSGLVLGGGISFLSGERGFACDNVKGFEVVLASGETVYATSHQHADLYKALRGGSSNFGIVTHFDLYTYAQPTGKGWGGISTTVLSTDAAQSQQLDLITAYNTHGASSDPASGAVMTMITTTGGTRLSYMQLWHSSGSSTPPPVFEDAAKLPGVYGRMTVGELVGSGVSPDRGTSRNHFATGTIRACREAVHTVHRIVNEEFKEAVSAEGVVGIVVAVAFQPITGRHIKVGASARGGNVLGLEKKGGGETLTVLELAVTWVLESDDAVVLATQERAMRKVMEWAEEKRVAHPWLYLNDAGPKFNQPAIASYGARNVEFLRRVRKRYDPHGVFTKLMPGGFKI